uniref:Uncharacterized protein n=1 Tax=Plectus sambesii TaxID=2011161 RepID=A0A914V3U0_9BILA
MRQTVAESWSWLIGYSAVLKRLDEKAKRTSRSDLCKHAIDALLGWIVVSAVLGYRSSAAIDKEVRQVSGQLELLISSLEKLIDWLMGNPAGLKLNKPLNHTLGHFFLYHIYLWRTYLTFLNPALEAGLVLLRWISLLGVSMQIALVVDFVAVFTLHIYCFHVYAARSALLLISRSSLAR